MTPKELPKSSQEFSFSVTEVEGTPQLSLAVQQGKRIVLVRGKPICRVSQNRFWTSFCDAELNKENTFCGVVSDLFVTFQSGSQMRPPSVAAGICWSFGRVTCSTERTDILSGPAKTRLGSSALLHGQEYVAKGRVGRRGCGPRLNHQFGSL